MLQESRISETRTEPDPAYHPGLDGVRGIAILLVLLFHFVHNTSAKLVGTPLFHDLTQFGWMGVDLFFVLSGFLITGILLDTRASPHYYRSFYARRALRTLPLYYVGLGGALALQGLAARQAGAGEFTPHWLLWLHLANVAVLLDAGHWATLVGVGHFWSLSVEEHFYLLWPPVVRRFPAAGLLAVTLLLIAAATLIRYAVGASWGPLAGYTLTPCRMDLLAVGGLLALGTQRGWSPQQLRAPLRPAALAALALLALLCVWRRSGHPFDRVVQLAGFPCIAVLAAALVAEGLRSARPSRLGRLLEHPELRRCGQYSYGLYVWHGLMLPHCARLHEKLTLVTGSGLVALGLYLPTVLGLSAGVAYLSYRCLELPFLRLKARFPR